MRYIDTGARDASEALGAWLDDEVRSDASIAELRLQSGFFGAESLGYFAGLMERLRDHDGVFHVLVGSNEGVTTRADIGALIAVAGPPRNGQRIGVVKFDNAYFHPKTIHLSREDGSRAAYVGSANVTGSGVASLHVEAGLLLDSREGDDHQVLDEIAARIDWWFTNPREGLYVVTAPEDLDELVIQGILNVPRPVLPASGRKGSTKRGKGARLSPLLKPPPLPEGIVSAPPPVIVAEPPAAPVVVPAAATPPRRTTAASWGKPLTRSDAQRKAMGNQRGSITLTQAGYDINPQSWFRRDLFASAKWTAGTTRTGQPREIARIPFETTFLGKNLGVMEIEVSFAPNREASQDNYTTLLHLGPLGPLFVQQDVEGRQIEITRRTDGTFALSIT